MAAELSGGALAGRDGRMFFDAKADGERFVYPDSVEVDFDNHAAFDAEGMDTTAINCKIRELMRAGHGHITMKNPGAKHSLAAGILNRLRLDIEGSVGYFGCGLNDGPNIRISGRAGWSCAENMMSGTVVVDKNAGSTFGAAIRGGDLVCRGDVGGRAGVCMKGGTILIGGRAGAFCGFMMQRGRMIILGDAGGNLGDTMYDGLIYVGGKIASLGVDAAETEMTAADCKWLNDKLALYGISAPGGAENMTKITSGKQLWNYDNLEPGEKKIVL